MVGISFLLVDSEQGRKQTHERHPIPEGVLDEKTERRVVNHRRHYETPDAEASVLMLLQERPLREFFLCQRTDL